MNAVQHILIFAVRLYQCVISPPKALLFGPLARCRFTPSCSQYAVEALRMHGALRGSPMALRRICRCHPWGGCGDDPVPPRVTCDEWRVTSDAWARNDGRHASLLTRHSSHVTRTRSFAVKP